MSTGPVHDHQHRSTGHETAANVVEAPCRADFCGGTLDIWPLGVLHPGSLTVNAAVPVWVRLEVDSGWEDGAVGHRLGDEAWRHIGPEESSTDLTAAVCFALRPQGGLRVRVLEQAPLRAGLGGSSSYAVALARAVLALDERVLEDGELVPLLRDLEARVLAAPTGAQDHWAAVRGGVLALRIEPGREAVEPLAVAADWLAERFSLFFTGLTHHSGMVNWQVIRRRLDGDHATVQALDAIVEASRGFHQALLERDERACGRAIAKEWAARKRLAPEVCPPDLDRLERIALDAGARAVKGCGAGGGGTLLIWHDSGRRQSVAAALEAAAAGGAMLPAGIAAGGCRVTPLDPNHT